MAQAKYVDLSIGPHHSTAIGPFSLSVKTDGETVYSGEPDIGYLHRGIEKIAEKMTWTGFLPYCDRLDYLASIHGNLVYALAVEKIAAIDVPARANYIRVVVSELNRISSHLVTIGMLASRLGLRTALMYSLRDRERINNLFEVVCGARLTYSYIRIGGVISDVTDGFIEKTYEFVEYLLPKLKEYHDLISHNHVATGRLASVGVVTAERAIQCGISGPILRGAGVKLDTRKVAPYSGYDKIDFDTPLGHEEVGTLGDAFDRHMVRMNEIEQSCLIIKQALDLLPDGAFNVSLPRLFEVPKGEAYVCIESPRGALGVYVQSDGGKHPSRVKFRAPSFPVLNLFPAILENVPLSDVATIVGSLDIMVSEVDR